MDVAAFFHLFKANAVWRRLIVAANLGGIAYGFVYYGAQFDATPPEWWLFVPDSPLAVLWATIPLVLYEFGKRRYALLDGLAFVANVQVGVWTAFVLAYHSEHFGTWDGSLNTLLLVLHLGMAVEAMIFVKDLRDGFRNRAAAAVAVPAALVAWLFVNDWLDYFYQGIDNGGCGGLRPYTVPCHELEFVALVTFVISFATVALLVLLTHPLLQRAGAPSDE